LCMFTNSAFESIYKSIIKFLIDCGNYPHLVKTFTQQTCASIMKRILYLVDTMQDPDIMDLSVYLQDAYLAEIVCA